MKISREQFLSLKVILMHTFVDKGYFFDWASQSGSSDKIKRILSELKKKLEELDKRYPDNILLPSQEYQAAIESIEFTYENLADFLLIHESIDLFLSAHLDFLEAVNTAFHKHFVTKILPLRPMLLKSTVHDSVFGQWISQSHFYNFIRTISFELQDYFYKMDSKYQAQETHYSFMTEFVDAIRYMDHNPIHFQTFIKNHPTVILIFINHIEILENTNQAFQDYLEGQKGAALATQSLTETKEESKEEEKAFSMDYSKWIEKLNTFNSSDSAQNIFKKTAVELQESGGNPTAALIALERLEANLMLKQYVTPPETRKHLNAQFSWTRKKIMLLQLILTQLEKTEEEQKQLCVNYSEWSQTLNNFSSEYTSSNQHSTLTQFNLNYPSEIQKIFKKTAIKLQESNGDVMKISDALEILETDLQLRMTSPLFFSIQPLLQKHADWVKETLKEFNLQIKAYKTINKLDMDLKEKSMASFSSF